MECIFCKDAGIDYDHPEDNMTHHPQSGDRCCLHCAETLLFRHCIFCDKKDDCIKPENNDEAYSGCDE